MADPSIGAFEAILKERERVVSFVAGGERGNWEKTAMSVARHGADGTWQLYLPQLREGSKIYL
jgi:hypothetical protein